MEGWNNGFNGMEQSEPDNFPLIHPTFHHSTIPPFQTYETPNRREKIHNDNML
jgi:hypothetical protein